MGLSARCGPPWLIESRDFTTLWDHRAKFLVSSFQFQICAAGLPSAANQGISEATLSAAPKSGIMSTPQSIRYIRRNRQIQITTAMCQ